MKIHNIWVLALFTVCPTLWAQQEDHRVWAEKKDAVANAIYDALDVEYQIRLGLTQVEEPLGKVRRGKKVGGYVLKSELVKERERMQAAGLQIQEYQLEITDIEPMELKGNRLSCYATERGRLLVLDRKGGEEVETIEITKHLFTLLYKDGFFTIVEDQLVDHLPLTDPSTFPKDKPAGLELFGEPLNENTLRRLELRKENQTPFLNKAATYNRYNASDYAIAHAYNYNSDYRTFAPTDCTNFVSQAMRAGNWVDDLGWYRGQSNWWYNQYNQTWTWVNAHYFWYFMYYSDRGILKQNKMDLSVGDVVIADWDWDSNMDHAMVVTYKTSSEIYLSYHSNDVRHKAFSSMPNAVYSFWKVVSAD